MAGKKKQSLWLLIFLIFISGGAYLPIWFTNKQEILKVGELPKLFMSLIAITLVAGFAVKVWLGANLQTIEGKIQPIFIQNMVDGKSLSDSGEYLKLASQQIDYQLKLTQLNMIFVAIGLFLLVYSFKLKSRINKELSETSKKKINSWLFIIPSILLYLLFIGLEMSSVALIWSIIPMVLIMQRKINTNI